MDKYPWSFIHKNLYALKRQYGISVTVYKLLDVDTDYRTGRKTVSRELHQVRRAIMLPEEILRRAGRSSTDKVSSSGAGFERGDATFIFDPRDLPTGFQFGLDDFVIVKGEFYKLIRKEEYGTTLAWVLQARRVSGTDLNVILEASAESLVMVSQIATMVLEP